ncbi:MAG: LytTR family DNA-binding domain-containing protein [Bacteroidota bacterium]
MIRTVIIDDEEDARSSLQLILGKYCPEIDILASIADPLEALEKLPDLQPDLVFLDVEMPRLSGFGLLERIASPSFQTIFVTAHNHYAIKAIRFSALDYLLKPVDIDELRMAVDRAAAKIGNQSSQEAYQSILHNLRPATETGDRLAVPTQAGMDFIPLEKLVYCQAEGSYTRLVFMDADSKLISKKLKEFEHILDPKRFCRVHHGYLINVRQVKQYVKGEGGYVIMQNGDHVDISRRKKEAFLRLIKRV